MEPWQSQALRSALKALCAFEPPAASAGDSPASVSPSPSDHLSLALPLTVLSTLHALSPKASCAAFHDLEQAARHFPRADLPAAAAASPPRPHLLRDLAQLVVEPASGHLLVRVAAARGDPNASTYTVVLRDLRCVDRSRMALVAADPNGLMDVNCDCKAFAFRPAGETLCKHAVVAVVAAGANLAPTCFVAEHDFLEILRQHT